MPPTVEQRARQIENQALVIVRQLEGLLIDCRNLADQAARLCVEERVRRIAAESRPGT